MGEHVADVITDRAGDTDAAGFRQCLEPSAARAAHAGGVRYSRQLQQGNAGRAIDPTVSLGALNVASLRTAHFFVYKRISVRTALGRGSDLDLQMAMRELDRGTARENRALMNVLTLRSRALLPARSGLKADQAGYFRNRALARLQTVLQFGELAIGTGGLRR
jgi:hypothetical protein